MDEIVELKDATKNFKLSKVPWYVVIVDISEGINDEVPKVFL